MIYSEDMDCGLAEKNITIEWRRIFYTVLVPRSVPETSHSDVIYIQLITGLGMVPRTKMISIYLDWDTIQM